MSRTHPRRRAVPTLALTLAGLLLCACGSTLKRYESLECVTQPSSRGHLFGENAVPVPAPFRSLSDAASGLSQMERYFISHNDRRGVFAITYRETTTTLQDWLRRDRFSDAAATERLAVVFANAYRDALSRYEAGRPMPEAWRMAFEACDAGDDTLAADLILGINTHINYDLPFAVVQAGLDVQSEDCYRDYTRVNDALADATPRVRRQIVASYARRWKMMNCLFGKKLDGKTAQSFAQARERSWIVGRSMRLAHSAPDLANVRSGIDDRATSAARLIESGKDSPVRCLDALQTAGCGTAADSQ